MDAADHRIRRPAGRGTGRARLERIDQDAAAQLDRPQRRGRGRFLHRQARERPTPERAFGEWKHAQAAAGFPKEPADDVLRIYTTRPDTLFGATYMVLAPEHPFVDRLTTAAQRQAVERYRRSGRRKKRSRPHRSGQAEDGSLHRVLCAQPASTAKKFRFGSPITCSSATGPAQSWPCRPTTCATGNSRSSSICRLSLSSKPPGRDTSRRGKNRRVARTVDGRKETPFAGQGTAINSGTYDGTADGRVQKTDHARPGDRPVSAEARSITGCATGSSAASTIGASPSRSGTSWTRPAIRPA